MRKDTEELLEKLTTFQRRAVMERLNSKSDAEAVQKAGSKAKHPAQVASKLFGIPDVKSAFIAVRDELEEDQHLSHAQACRILSEQAQGNVSDFMDENGQIDVSRVLHPENRSKLAGIKFDEYFDNQGNRHLTIEVKLSDRVQAIRELAKLKGWHKLEVSGEIKLHNVLQLDDIREKKVLGGD